MQLIDEEKLLRIMSVFEGLETTLASGGSAANAVSGVARMGIESGFIGKIGRDAYGRFFREDMERNGVQTLLIEGEQASGCAMTMITPDGERTFGTFLGAAATLCAEELSVEMFEGYDILAYRRVFGTRHFVDFTSRTIGKRGRLVCFFRYGEL